jgi:thioredoxin-dependent peroxiredoxin
MGDLGNAGRRRMFKSDSKDGSGNSNVADILADFLTKPGNPRVTCYRELAISNRTSRRRKHEMSLRINSEAPDFTAETTQGTISFHQWIGEGWAILFSHPKDFTPVCTTELGYMARLKPEFEKRGCKIIGLSVDPVAQHGRWSKDIEETQGYAVNYPMIGDPELKVAKLYDMLPADAGDTAAGRTPADNATVRSVFIIGPDKKIKAMLTYPMSSGRNFDEVLRLLDSCQLSAKHPVATPVNWKQGEDVIIVTSVTDDQAKARFPKGFRALKPYLRLTPQP